MLFPELKIIGGALNCQGNKELNEDSFPALVTVEGDIVLAGAGFRKLPKNLRTVNGRAILSRNDHKSLIEDMLRAEREGIIRGGVFYCD